MSPSRVSPFQQIVFRAAGMTCRFAIVVCLSVSILVTLPAVSPGADDSLIGHIEALMASPESKADRRSAPANGNMAAVKTASAAEVAKRQRALDRLAVELAKAPADCGHNVLLSTRIAETAATLSEIAGRIAAATDAKSARSAAADLFPRTRVFALVLPQVHLVLSCDKLTVEAQTLQSRVAAAQVLLDAMKGDTTDAAAAGLAAQATVRALPGVTALSASVAGLMPDNGDTAVLSSNIATLNAARVSLRQYEQTYDGAAKAVQDFEKFFKKPGKKSASNSAGGNSGKQK